jgi:hypothetical protein
LVGDFRIDRLHGDCMVCDEDELARHVARIMSRVRQQNGYFQTSNPDEEETDLIEMGTAVFHSAGDELKMMPVMYRGGSVFVWTNFDCGRKCAEDG